MAGANPQEQKAIQDAIIEKNKAVGKFLDRVSVLICPFWHQFGCYSGIEPAVVDAIEQDEIGVQSKADRLLQKMQDKQLDWSIIEDILLRQKQYEVIRQLRAERDLIPRNLIQDINFFKTSAKLEVNLNEYEAVSIFLDKVATKIGGFWERFSNYAGCDIGIIKADGGGAQKQAYKLLSKMRAESSPLKWITIKDILSDMGRNDVIRFLEIEIDKLKGIYGKHPFFHTDNDTITTTPIQESNFNNDIDTITTAPIQDSIYSIDFNNETINYVINKETVPDIVKECNSETPMSPKRKETAV